MTYPDGPSDLELMLKTDFTNGTLTEFKDNMYAEEKYSCKIVSVNVVGSTLNIRTKEGETFHASDFNKLRVVNIRNVFYVRTDGKYYRIAPFGAEIPRRPET